MNYKSRTENVIRNVSFGFLCKIIDTIFSFIARVVFIKYLGEEILGINGLFTNLFSLLSLADLGFGTAMSFSFYEPLSQKNEKKIAALIQFYKRVYTIITIVILLLGITLIPFLKYLINFNQKVDGVYYYYVLLLINSALSYMFVYKSAIIQADQNSYIISACNTFSNIFRVVSQLLVLLVYKNYYLFLIIQIVFTISNNFIISRIADKKYPFINKSQNLDISEKKNIFQNVKSILLYKISGTLLNGTDNILISVIVGTIYVGYYSNYLLVINSIIAFVNIIFSSLYGSLGNLIQDMDGRKNDKVFNILLFIGYFIGTTSSACLMSGLNDFVSIFFGSQYLLSTLVMLVIVGNYYFSCICQPIWTFRETAGMFRKVKYLMLLTAIINLILSIFLGYVWGVFGILLASLISKLSTYFWYEPTLLYKNVINGSVKKYFFKIAKYFAYSLLSMIPSIILIKYVSSNILILLIKVVVSGLLSMIVFLVLNKNDINFQEFIHIINNKLKSFKNVTNNFKF